MLLQCGRPHQHPHPWSGRGDHCADFDPFDRSGEQSRPAKPRRPTCRAPGLDGSGRVRSTEWTWTARPGRPGCASSRSRRGRQPPGKESPVVRRGGFGTLVQVSVRNSVLGLGTLGLSKRSRASGVGGGNPSASLTCGSSAEAGSRGHEGRRAPSTRRPGSAHSRLSGSLASGSQRERSSSRTPKSPHHRIGM